MRLPFLLLSLLVSVAVAAPPTTLEVGVLGAMSGPASRWGLTNRYCAEVTAAMYNAHGGVLIDGHRYPIAIRVEDTALDPVRAVEGARRLVRGERVRYIIGPNVDDTTRAVMPVLEAGGAMNISFGFNPDLFSPPRSNTILGMAASYQVAPIVYRYLQEQHGVTSVAFIARDDQESLNQRNVGIDTAHELGLAVRSLDAYDISELTYRNGESAADLIQRFVATEPDLLVLSGVTPAEAPRLIELAREAGFRGQISTETAQDIALLGKVGAAAEGFISVGGTQPEENWSPYMQEFVRRYTALAGEWNDEAGTKAYALEMILRTLQVAGAGALTDTALFRRAMETASFPDPFSKQPRRLRYVGRKAFGQPRQLAVPVIVNAVRDGRFHVVFTGELPE